MANTLSKAAQILSKAGHNARVKGMTKEEKSEHFRLMRVNGMPGDKIYKHQCSKCGYKWESKLEHPKQCAFCKRYTWNK